MARQYIAMPGGGWLPPRQPVPGWNCCTLPLPSPGQSISIAQHWAEPRPCDPAGSRAPALPLLCRNHLTDDAGSQAAAEFFIPLSIHAFSPCLAVVVSKHDRQ